jgi:hypothetical protein
MHPLALSFDTETAPACETFITLAALTVEIASEASAKCQMRTR